MVIKALLWINRGTNVNHGYIIDNQHINSHCVIYTQADKAQN